MANFIESTLEPGEQVIFKGRLHWSFNVSYTVWGILFIVGCIVGLVFNNTNNGESIYNVLSIVLAIIGLSFIVFGYFIRSKTEFVITSTRFIQKDGIFNIKMTEIPLFKVETINFYQTLIDRILGTGSIELVGSGGTNHRVDFLQEPYNVRNLIATYMKVNKQKAEEEENKD